MLDHDSGRESAASLVDLNHSRTRWGAGYRWRAPLVFLVGFAVWAPGGGVGCGGGRVDVDGDGGQEPGDSAVYGRLAAPTSGRRSTAGSSDGRSCSVGPLGEITLPLSLDEVSVDLVQRDQMDDSNPSPDDWPVVQTALPDPTGAFAFEDLVDGDYALRVNQPEFADFAYGVDSTEFHLEGGQTVTLVLPLVTTITHNLMDPDYSWNAGSDNLPAAALDDATGEIVLASNLGLAVVDPDRGKMDLLTSRNFFLGREESDEGWPRDRRVVALAPNTGIAWILYPDRLVRVARSLFSDPDASEVLDLDQLATRAAVGDKFQFHMLSATANPNPNTLPQWTGDLYFSPDEKVLYASTENQGVKVFDLEQMEIVRVILGHVIGYNPASNHLFITNGDYGQNNGTDLLVVDASTFLEVNSAPLRNVLGVAPVPDSVETVLVRAQESTSDVLVPFVVVIDGSGAIVTDERASDYLGVESDPEVGAPSFDLTGQYFMIGSAAFRVLEAGAFEPVPVGVPPGSRFLERMQCNNQRMVDPANLLEIWYSSNQQCPQGKYAGFLSLDQTGMPVAVRPGVPTRELLLDRTHGRAIFVGFDRLVLVHYADPSAAESDEVVDLSAVVAPFTEPGATCSGANPCSGTDLCAGATDTAYTGQCTPNPRLPYLPFCGGFGQAECDDDFDCELVNPTNPNSVGECIGYPDRDFEAAGPACVVDLACPAGMACGGTDRCEPKVCLWDADCAAYPGEICGSVANLGRVCLVPGTLADGTACLGPEECLHGACVAITGAKAMGDTELLHGIRGMAACTTPCYHNADCAGGEECVSKDPRPLGDDDGTSMVWKSHRQQVMPYCQPANLPPLDGCEACTSEELCAMGNTPEPRCQLGFSPQVLLEYSSWATYCLPPAEDCQISGFCPDGPTFDYQCKFPCQRSGDCSVFSADCVNGSCTLDSPCDLTCGLDESCAWFDHTHGFCAIADSCRSDADCGGAAGSCLLHTCIGPARTCTRGSDCEVGEECVEWWNDGMGRRCLPAQCGCVGPDSGDAVCDFQTDTCLIQYQCTDVPCDGTVIAECDVTAPDPLPTTCVCPGCAWNNTCPGMPPVPLCPDDFTCANMGIGGQPPHVGPFCACATASCQTP